MHFGGSLEIAVVGSVFWGMNARTRVHTPKYGVFPRQLLGNHFGCEPAEPRRAVFYSLFEEMTLRRKIPPR
jgi:hypothetical protein